MLNAESTAAYAKLLPAQKKQVDDALAAIKAAKALSTPAPPASSATSTGQPPVGSGPAKRTPLNVYFSDGNFSDADWQQASKEGWQPLDALSFSRKNFSGPTIPQALEDRLKAALTPTQANQYRATPYLPSGSGAKAPTGNSSGPSGSLAPKALTIDQAFADQRLSADEWKQLQAAGIPAYEALAKEARLNGTWATSFSEHMDRSLHEQLRGLLTQGQLEGYNTWESTKARQRFYTPATQGGQQSPKPPTEDPAVSAFRNSQEYKDQQQRISEQAKTIENQGNQINDLVKRFEAPASAPTPAAPTPAAPESKEDANTPLLRELLEATKARNSATTTPAASSATASTADVTRWERPKAESTAEATATQADPGVDEQLDRLRRGSTAGGSGGSGSVDRLAAGLGGSRVSGGRQSLFGVRTGVDPTDSVLNRKGAVVETLTGGGGAAAARARSTAFLARPDVRSYYSRRFN